MVGFLRRVIGFVTRPTHSRTIGLVAILILVAAVSLTVYVSQQQQEIRQRAAGPSLPPPISIAKCELNCATVNLNKCEITERVTGSNRQQIIDACIPLKSCNDGCPLVEHFSTYIPIAKDLKTLSSYLSSMNAYVTTIKQLTGDQYSMLYSQYYKPKLSQLTEALQSSPTFTPVPPADIPVSATVSAIPSPSPTPNILHVRSTKNGATVTGVVIELAGWGTKGTSGTTDYSFESSNDINTVLKAPITFSGANLSGWIGCDNPLSSGGPGALKAQYCYVTLTKGVTQTVTVNYTTPSPTPNILHVRSTKNGATVTGVVIEHTGWGTKGTSGTTDYSFESSNDINTVLKAPITFSGANLSGWIGCDDPLSSGGPGALKAQYCYVTLTKGVTQTITVNYTTPTLTPTLTPTPTPICKTNADCSSPPSCYSSTFPPTINSRGKCLTGTGESAGQYAYCIYATASKTCRTGTSISSEWDTCATACSASVTPTVIPSAAPVLLAADVNQDGCVSISDFNEWLYSYQNNGTSRNSNYKPDMDGKDGVNLSDYNLWFTTMKLGQNLCGQ